MQFNLIINQELVIQPIVRQLTCCSCEIIYCYNTNEFLRILCQHKLEYCVSKFLVIQSQFFHETAYENLCVAISIASNSDRFKSLENYQNQIYTNRFNIRKQNFFKDGSSLPYGTTAQTYPYLQNILKFGIQVLKNHLMSGKMMQLDIIHVKPSQKREELVLCRFYTPFRIMWYL